MSMTTNRELLSVCVLPNEGDSDFDAGRQLGDVLFQHHVLVVRAVGLACRDRDRLLFAGVHSEHGALESRHYLPGPKHELQRLAAFVRRVELLSLGCADVVDSYLVSKSCGLFRLNSLSVIVSRACLADGSLHEGSGQAPRPVPRSPDSRSTSYNSDRVCILSSKPAWVPFTRTSSIASLHRLGSDS